MVTVWWNRNGLIHHSFLQSGLTITSDRYINELEKVHKKLTKEAASLVKRKGVILLHDNARPHVAKQTLLKIRDLKLETLLHPDYSPDLSPTDFHFFKHLDHFLSGKYFCDEDQVKKAFDEFIASRSDTFYKDGFDDLVNRWQKCVDAEGDYFD
jgi:transposase